MQQLSLLGPQFVVPATLIWQLGGWPHLPFVHSGVVAPHGTVLPNCRQPLAATVQDITLSVDAHCGALHAFVQHAPALQAPLLHVEVDDSYTQFCESFEHMASVVEFAQVLPAALQTGSVLHTHEAEPVAPAQLWRVPQATGVP